MHSPFSNNSMPNQGTKEIVEVDGAFVCPGLQDVVNICVIPKPNVLLTERLQKLPWRQNAQHIWNFTETLQSLCMQHWPLCCHQVLALFNHHSTGSFIFTSSSLCVLMKTVLCGPWLGDTWGKSARNIDELAAESNHR